MKIYMKLPFTNTRYNEDGPSANLTPDYEAIFKTTSRYKFDKELRIGTDEKGSSLSGARGYNNWIYTPFDPKTFHIYQGG